MLVDIETGGWIGISGSVAADDGICVDGAADNVHWQQAVDNVVVEDQRCQCPPLQSRAPPFLPRPDPLVAPTNRQSITNHST